MRSFTYFASPFPFDLDLLLSPLPSLTKFAIISVSSSEVTSASDSCVLLSGVLVAPCAGGGDKDSPSSALRSSWAHLPAVSCSVLVISVGDM